MAVFQPVFVRLVWEGGPVMHTCPMSLTWEIRKTQKNTAEEDGMAGKPRNETDVVLNPPLVHAQHLNESRNVFPSIFITESS